MWKRKQEAITRAIKEAGGRLNLGLRSLGMRLNAYLQARTKGVPVKRMKLSVILFCLIGSGWFVWLAMHAEFTVSAAPRPVSKPAAIVPIKVRPRGRRATWRLDSSLFRRYLDSLQADSVFMESLRRGRPGLEDSMLELEQHYHHH